MQGASGPGEAKRGALKGFLARNNGLFGVFSKHSIHILQNAKE